MEQEHVSSLRFLFVFCRDEKHTKTPLDEEMFHLSRLAEEHSRGSFLQLNLFSKNTKGRLRLEA